MSKYVKPNWYPEEDVKATKSGWVYTKNHDEVLSAIGYLDEKIAAEEVVANIDERDALSPIETTMVLVADASGDETVTTGGATYVYNPATLTWTKIGKIESMDLVLSWSNITGRPNSSVADIDDAVQKKHSHSNINELNKIGQDVEGNLTYGGNYPHIGLDLVNW